MIDPVEFEKLTHIAADLKIGQFTRHIFLCIGETCCSRDEGDRAWTELKNQLKAKNLSLASGPTACYRTKVGCLRICKGGPILVVYPEGHWYCGMTSDRIERFIESQIERGEPIPEWIFASNPLPANQAD